MIRKIWNDPVGSKIIATGIIAICAYIYSLHSEETYLEVIRNMWYYQIHLGWTIVIVVSFITLKSLWKKNGSNKLIPDKLEQKQEMFKKANTKISFDDNLIVRFTTWFDTGSGLPFIADESAYCTLHTTPMRMNSQGCSELNCRHNNYRINMSGTKHKIESILINNWEKFKDQ